MDESQKEAMSNKDTEQKSSQQGPRQNDKQDELTVSGDAQAGKSTQKSFTARGRGWARYSQAG